MAAVVVVTVLMIAVVIGLITGITRVVILRGRKFKTKVIMGMYLVHAL